MTTKHAFQQESKGLIQNQAGLQIAALIMSLLHCIASVCALTLLFFLFVLSLSSCKFCCINLCSCSFFDWQNQLCQNC